MSRVSRRGVIARSRSAAKTYAQFQTETNRLSGGNFRDANFGTFDGAGTYTVMSLSPPGGAVMQGTSWNDQFRDDQTNCIRAIQHAVPSQAIFDQMTATSHQCLCVIESRANKVVGGISRNNYTSNSALDANRVMTLYIRWDDVQKRAFQADPSTGGAETEYVW